MLSMSPGVHSAAALRRAVVADLSRDIGGTRVFCGYNFGCTLSPPRRRG